MTEPTADHTHVWIGDLAGFEVLNDKDSDSLLEHRCGWSKEIKLGDSFLGNLVTYALEHRAEGCRRTT